MQTKSDAKVIQPQKYTNKYYTAFAFEPIPIQIASLCETVLVPKKQNPCHMQQTCGRKPTSTE